MIDDKKAWQRLFDAGHGSVDPDLGTLLAHAIEDKSLRHTHEFPLVVVDVGSLVHTVRRSIWTAQYRALPVATFNEIHEYLFWRTLHRRLAEIASAFAKNGFRRVKFACLFDSARQRPSEKTLELSKRFELELRDLASKRLQLLRKRYAKSVKTWNDCERIYQRLAAQGEEFSGPKPEKPRFEVDPTTATSSRPLTSLLEIDQIVIPTAPRTVARHSFLSDDEQFKGYQLEDVVYYQSQTEAELLLRAAVSPTPPLPADFPPLDYFTVLDPSHRYVPTNVVLRFANVSDFDLFHLVDEHDYGTIIHLVSLALSNRMKWALAPSDDIAPPQPGPDGSGGEKVSTWRFLDLSSALADTNLFGCRTVQGRAALSLIIGCDLIPGVRGVSHRTFTSQASRSQRSDSVPAFNPVPLCEFLDAAPTSTSFVQLQSSEQRDQELRFSRLVAALPGGPRDPSALDHFDEFLSLQSILMGRSLAEVVDKNDVYRRDRSDYLLAPPSSAQLEHKARTEQSFGTGAQPRNFELIFQRSRPKSNPSDNARMDSQTVEEEDSRPIVSRNKQPPFLPAPRSHREKPLPLQRRHLPTFHAEVQGRLDHVHPAYIDRSPLPSVPPSDPCSPSTLSVADHTFADFGPGFASEYYRLAQAFRSLIFDPPLLTTSSAPTLLSTSPTSSSTPPDAPRTDYHLLNAHVAVVLAARPELAAITRVASSVFRLIASSDPRLFRFVDLASPRAVENFLVSTGTAMSHFATNNAAVGTRTATPLYPYRKSAASADSSATKESWPTLNCAARLAPTLISRATALSTHLTDVRKYLFVAQASKNPILRQLLLEPENVRFRFVEVVQGILTRTDPSHPLPLLLSTAITPQIQYLLGILSDDLLSRHKSTLTENILSVLTSSINSPLPALNLAGNVSYDQEYPRAQRLALRNRLVFLHQVPRATVPPPLLDHDYDNAVLFLFSFFAVVRVALPRICIAFAADHARYGQRVNPDGPPPPPDPTRQNLNSTRPSISRKAKDAGAAQQTALRQTERANYRPPLATSDTEAARIVNTLFPAGDLLGDRLKDPTLFTGTSDEKEQVFFPTKNGFEAILFYVLGYLEIPYSPNAVTFNQRTGLHLFSHDGHANENTRLTQARQTIPAIQMLCNRHEYLTLQARAYNSALEKKDERHDQGGAPTDSTTAPRTSLSPPPSIHRQKPEEIASNFARQRLRRVDRLLAPYSDRKFEDLLDLEPVDRLLWYQRQFPHELFQTELASSPLFKKSLERVPDGGIALFDFDLPLALQTFEISSASIARGFGSDQLVVSSRLPIVDALPHEVVHRIIRTRRDHAHIPHGLYTVGLDGVHVLNRLPSVLSSLPAEDDVTSISLVEKTLYDTSAYSDFDPVGISTYVRAERDSGTSRSIVPLSSVLTPSPDQKIASWYAARALKRPELRRPLTLKSSLEPKILNLIFERVVGDNGGPFFSSIEALTKYKLTQSYNLELLRYRVLGPTSPEHQKVLVTVDPGENYPFAVIAVFLDADLVYSDLVSNTRNRAEQSTNARIRTHLEKLHPATTLVGFIADETSSSHAELIDLALQTGSHRSVLKEWTTAYERQHPQHRISHDLAQNTLLLSHFTKSRQKASESEKQSLVSIMWESLLPRSTGMSWEVTFVGTDVLLSDLESKHKKKGPATSSVYLRLMFEYFSSRRDIDFCRFEIREDYTSRTCCICFSPDIVHPTNMNDGRTINRITICPDCEFAGHRDVVAARVLAIVVLLAVHTGGHYALSPLHENEGFHYGEAEVPPRPVKATFEADVAARYAASVAEMKEDFPAFPDARNDVDPQKQPRAKEAALILRMDDGVDYSKKPWYETDRVVDQDPHINGSYNEADTARINAMIEANKEYSVPPPGGTYEYDGSIFPVGRGFEQLFPLR